MPLVVKVAARPEEMQHVMALRQRVFIHEQGRDPAQEINEPYDNKPSTIHFLGKNSETNQYVAVARCLLDEANQQAKFGRVAVLSECRGKGFGVQLMDATETHVAQHHSVESFALSSQYERRGFYEKCGYHRPSDESYLEGGTKHCWMIKHAHTPSPSSSDD
ncbi:unnamed protein product [Phytophthora lilii]|uniref:Unnamed protein product n=1 Tax=Phytophthora lilii TaxID=2077276 RepID=A0A9W6TEI5_9STRA|nr:unnamed protein product [Phytophthora lilii]